jgi:hypothetical protein
MPTHNSTAKKIHNNRKVLPAFACFQIRHVTGPELIWAS